MPDYGITDKGFVLKRLDTILEEIHTDLTDGWKVDTRLAGTSFLNTLITTFGNQIANLWETAQDSYYAKYPATATELNLDHAVQYGGIKRAGDKRTSYILHCTGDDGTYVRENAVVATNTTPEIRLFSAEEFQIARERFNKVSVIVASEDTGVYTVSINGNQYSYSNPQGGKSSAILAGLAAAIKDEGYEVKVEDDVLIINDKTKTRENVLTLTDNLTTSSVTSLANFLTNDYGKITLPYNIVTRMVNNITGFTAVTNLLEPTYGRKRETDIELRQSYIAKSALRSNTMIESIIAELLNNVEDVESASGYENDMDVTDERGLPPHSIEIIVEGGDNTAIAKAIFRRKAGGIQTHGSVVVNVPGEYGDTIPVRFNRPEYLYAWLKVQLEGDEAKIPVNYSSLTKQSLMEDGAQMTAGTSLLTQLLNEGIYDRVAGLTKIIIYTAYTTDSTVIPGDGDYQRDENIMATSRQKVLIDENRIEVVRK
ncbi:hypothetical protein NSB25_11305 [Acetatifactor muris]|uniref:Baseplate protein J-like domain-containing protein n=1 Tax=Acetatifactor muris TaxID=879566 RepID=A0A2K4ZGV3_9FIRM|nr:MULTISPECIES: hypothetical protein [Acetatifactor]MCR2047871.1 hypothetical protein [Acetatifactor muris]SOY29674.1 hypothetical protein AMURIS_02395 [Acetatifactor muris]